MNYYKTSDIRNITLVGHGGEGNTRALADLDVLGREVETHATRPGDRNHAAQ